MSVFRKLFPSEAGKYCDHLLRLDAEDRYLRFSTMMTDENIRRYVAKINWDEAVVVGFFDCGELHGACEARISGVNGSRRAELAFSVEKEFQGHGIGRSLMRRVLTVVQNRGIQLCDILCLFENRRMRHLGSHYARQVTVDHGEVEMTIELDQPTQISWFLEAVDFGEGMITTLLDRLQYPDAKAHVPFHGWSA
jgi:GNAT superfamily N-acetyltransferase